MDKLKIKISETAYDKLANMLTSNNEYDFLRFSARKGCGNSSKLDILLDNFKEGDRLEEIENLPILYDDEVAYNIKEITIVYRNNSFMVKTMPTNNTSISTNKCNHCCSGCKR